MTLLPIRPKQLDILKLLLKFRFINRYQIQTLLHHKDFSLIIIWLNDLTSKCYTDKIYSKKFPENTKPAIYFLKAQAGRKLKELEEFKNRKMNWIYKEGTRQKPFIEQCLFIVDLYIHLLSTLKDVPFHFLTQTDLSVYPYLKELDPHAYLVIENKGETKRFFIEVIDENKPTDVIKYRIKEYIDYCDEGEWEENTKHPFPTVLFICPDLGKKVYLIHHMNEDENDVNFYFLTKEEINSVK